HCLARVRYHVERLVLHFDEFERILSQVTVLRNNDGHRISDVANLVLRDWRLLGPLEPLNSSGPHRNGLHIRHVRGCEHTYNARPFGCLICHDLDDSGKGGGAPENGCVDHANPPNIAHVLANAAQKLRILNAFYSSTDVSHRFFSPTLKSQISQPGSASLFYWILPASPPPVEQRLQCSDSLCIDTDSH